MKRKSLIFVGAFLLIVTLFSANAYSNQVAGALDIGLSDNVDSGLFDYGFAVHAISDAGCDRYVLRNPNDEIIIDSDTAEVWDHEHGGINIFQGGYHNVVAGFYTLELWKNGVKTEYTLPYEIQEVDIPTTPPVILYPLRHATLYNSSITLTWDEYPILSGYDFMDYSVEVLNAYDSNDTQAQSVGDNLEATFVLSQGSYDSFLFARAFKIIETGSNPNFEGFQFIRSALTSVSFRVVDDLPELNIDDVINFYNDSVESGTIEGRGHIPWIAKLRLCIFKSFLINAKKQIANDNTDCACKNLKRALLRSDGQNRPRDLIEGSAVSELNDMIYEMMETLGCE